MKSIVVVAYYHIIHAMALALTFEEKPNLFVCVDYTRMDDEVLDNLRNTNAFNNVVKLNSRDFLDDFIPEIKKTKDFSKEEVDETGSSIFDEIIDSYYYPRFIEGGADFNENVYIYTEYHLCMYSIAKHFRSITLCEDGYKVMNKRLETFKLKGYFKYLPPFIDSGYYPKMEFRCDKIGELICSGDHENLPSDLRAKVKLWDIKDIIAENHDRYKDVITTAFPINDIHVDENTTLLIEQPLYRTHFCSDLNYYLLYKKAICKLSKDNNVAIKPHPGSIKNLEMFENDKVKVIPKWVPVEVFNYADIKFDSAITFYSAALELMENINEHKALYDGESHDPEHIKEFINEYIDGESINVGLFIYFFDIKDNLYKDIIKYYKKNKKITFTVYLFCPEDCKDNAVRLCKKIRSKIGTDIIIGHCDSFDQEYMFNAMLSYGSKHDYSIVLSGNNKAKETRKIIKSMCKGPMGNCIGIHQRCANSATVCNPLEDHVLTGIVNILFTNNIIDQFKINNIDDPPKAIQYIYENEISTSSIIGESLTTNASCRNDVLVFSKKIYNDELSELLQSYSNILDFVFEKKAGGRHVTTEEFAQIIERDGFSREKHIRALIDCMYEEHQIRYITNKRLNGFIYSHGIEITYEFIKKLRKIRKKLSKIIHQKK